jgi:hypothetical protein
MFATTNLDRSSSLFGNMKFSNITKTAENIVNEEWVPTNSIVSNDQIQMNISQPIILHNYLQISDRRFIFPSKSHQNLSKNEIIAIGELICGTQFDSFDHYKANRFSVSL